MAEIELRLTVEETNVVLEALGEQPFAKVFELIAKLQRQAQAQLGPTEDERLPAPHEANGDGPHDTTSGLGASGEVADGG